MGFRGTLISQYYDGELPQWFKDKHKEFILCPCGLLVSSKKERKYYGNDFFEDYQKAIGESGFWEKYDLTVVIALVGEDGFISKIEISKTQIKYWWTETFLESSGAWLQGMDNF